MNSVPSNQSTSSYHPPSSLIIIRELSSPRSLKSILIQPGEIIFLGRAGKSRYSARNNNGYFDNPSLRAAHTLLKCSHRSGRIYLHDHSSTIYNPPDGNCLMNGEKLKGHTLVENGDDITLRAAEGLYGVEHFDCSTIRQTLTIRYIIANCPHLLRMHLWMRTSSSHQQSTSRCLQDLRV